MPIQTLVTEQTATSAPLAAPSPAANRFDPAVVIIALLAVVSTAMLAGRLQEHFRIDGPAGTAMWIASAILPLAGVVAMTARSTRG